MDQPTLVALVLLGLGLMTQSSLAERTIIQHAWPGAFKGSMTLQVDECTSSVDGSGWTVSVVFDQPVVNMDIWRAQVLSRSLDKRTYELGNMQWNAIVYPNTYLTLEFIGYRTQNDQDGTRGTATLNGNGLCGQPAGLSSVDESSSLPDLMTDGSCDAEYEVLDEWPGNVKGRVRLPITSRLSGGWAASLVFSEPVNNLQIWTATIVGVSSDRRTYRLRNQQWNRRIREGEVYEAEFIASLSSSQIVPSFSFLMEDHPACDDRTSEVSSVVDNGICSCGTVRQLIDEWGNNFKGRVRVPVTNSLTGGWTAEIEFSEPVWNLQIWTGLVQGVDSTFTTYTIVNQQWNSDLLAGSYFDAEFIGTISAATPDFQIRLLGQPECECPEYYVTTTPMPTTTASTTNPPTTTTASTTNPPTTTASATSPSETTTAAPTTTTEASTSAETTIVVEVTTVVEVTSEPEVTTEEVPEVTTEEGSGDMTTIVDEFTFGPTTDDMQTTKGLPDVSTPPPKVGGDYDYDDVLHKSILFYEAQRSGALPSSNRIPYRGDSALGDRGNNGEDLIGGWYDAGDAVKFGLPMASSATLLAWGLIEYESAYKSAGEYNNALDSIKWATDYFVKCHVSPNEFYAQVGDGHYDHSLWGRPEELTGPRPAYKLDPSKPGSDVAGETAAALAAASIVFRRSDSAYSSLLLSHAISLFEFANNYRGYYSSSIQNADSFYHSSHYFDELGYAAAWLYRATGDQVYYTLATDFYHQNGLGAKPWAFDWDDKKAGLQMMMYQMSTGADQMQYENAVRTYLDSWQRGGDVTYTPGGLAWRSQWGALRYSANTAFLATIACREGLSYQYCDFAQEQIDYMLGSSGRSFVVGFGDNPPDRPHHRSSSCPDEPAPCGWNEFNAPGPNPQVLYGALVGGPNDRDEFVNDRGDYIQNEVACDYNAGFQSAVAGVKQLFMDRVLMDNPRALW